MTHIPANLPDLFTTLMNVYAEKQTSFSNLLNRINEISGSQIDIDLYKTNLTISKYILREYVVLLRNTLKACLDTPDTSDLISAYVTQSGSLTVHLSQLQQQRDSLESRMIIPKNINQTLDAESVMK